MGKGLDCSQIVLNYFAEDLGLSEKEALRISSCFGGGCSQGGTCGAVSGALMAIGLKYGHDDLEHLEQKDIMAAKRGAFIEAFLNARESTLCRDLLGHDISRPGEFEKVLEEGTMGTLCPVLCAECIQLTAELFPKDAAAPVKES